MTPFTTNRYARPCSGPWRPQGAPYYLVNQGNRFGFSSQVVEHPRVKDNRQLARISGLTGEVCKNYFESRPLGRTFTDVQLASARATLENAEIEVQKTHAIAAASAEMTDEAWLAFAMAPPARSYVIMVAAEVSAMRAEVAQLRAEADRLKAENESLTERLTAPADFKHQSDSHHGRTPAEA